jgi:hypothetical protein
MIQKVGCLFLAVCFFTLTGCSTTQNNTHEKKYGTLYDAVELTQDDNVHISFRYNGDIMSWTEYLVNSEKKLKITTIYFGFDNENGLVKYRIYFERRKVLHFDFYIFPEFKDEYVTIRMESIFAGDPMALVLEERDASGKMKEKRFISQWQSDRFFRKYCEQHKMAVEPHGKTIIQHERLFKGALPH